MYDKPWKTFGWKGLKRQDLFDVTSMASIVCGVCNCGSFRWGGIKVKVKVAIEWQGGIKEFNEGWEGILPAAPLCCTAPGGVLAVPLYDSTSIAHQPPYPIRCNGWLNGCFAAGLFKKSPLENKARVFRQSEMLDSGQFSIKSDDIWRVYG